MDKYIKNIFYKFDDLGIYLKLSKTSILKAKRIALSFYPANLPLRNNTGGFFISGFSIKMRKDRQAGIPVLRSANYYSDYSTDKERHDKNKFLNNKLKLKRFNSVKKIFSETRFLSRKNEEILDFLYEANRDEKYDIPVQFGMNVEDKGVTLKVYWYDKKHRLSKAKQYSILKKLFDDYFTFSDYQFFRDKKILSIGIDFSKKKNDIKIYLLYKQGADLLEVLDRFEFDAKDRRFIGEFLEESGKYFEDDVEVCFQIENGKLAIKKVEMIIKEKFRYDGNKSREIVKIFKERYYDKPEKNHNDKFIIACASCAVGKDFLCFSFV